MRYQITTVIATRALTRKQPNGTETRVEVRIGQPLPRHNVDTGVSDWYCPIQIVGADDESVRAAFGGDPVQALYLALVMAGELLSASPAGRAGQLSWHEVPNYGFPQLEIQLPRKVVEKLASAKNLPDHLKRLQRGPA